MRWGWVIIAAILGLASGSLGRAQAPANVKAELDVIVKAQEEASSRYHEGLAAGKTTEAKQAAVARYLEQVHKHTEEALALVQAHPTDPVVVEALKFVIK